jgi:hypothetical protein
MAESEHTAVGQALGYVYQFDRATYRLLEADENVVSIAVEHVDDVSVHRSDGSAIHEQDKATISASRTLTDRSVALWKTLSIWADQVRSGPTALRSTEFHLVTNTTVSTDSLASAIHMAVSESESEAVADRLLTASLSLRDDLTPFGTKLRELGPHLLAQLVSKISVLDNVVMTFGGNLDQLPSLRYFSPLQRQAVFNNASGWVRRCVLEAAQGGLPTTIDRAAFDQEVRALLRHASVAPLAVLFDTPSTELDPSRYTSHGFFQQLDWVDTDPGMVRDCVIHYAQARHTRAKWAETDAVSESVLRSYEDELQFRWRLLSGQQAQRTYSSPVAQGRELLDQTLSQDTALQGQQLPKAFTCGSFHALADFNHNREPAIGWHPAFKDKARGPKTS